MFKKRYVLTIYDYDFLYLFNILAIVFCTFLEIKFNIGDN